MRNGAGWHDVTICNVSSRGLMAKTPSPPQRGDFIEVRRNHVCIVGQVRWVYGTEFGLRTQDRIDIRNLCSPTAAKPAETAEAERRTAPRQTEPSSPEATAERSRMFARLFDHAIIVGCVVVVGVLLSQTIGSILATPLEKATKALQSANRRP
jgi:hypothetical protein